MGARYKTLVRFKVKNPRDFEDNWDKKVKGSGKTFFRFIDGFEFHGEDLIFFNGKENVSIEEFVKQNIAEDSMTIVVWVSCENLHNGVSYGLSVITSDAISTVGVDESIDLAKKNLYPRKVMANDNIYIKDTDEWIKINEILLAQGVTTSRTGKKNYIIELPDGRRLELNKEYFNEVNPI